MQTISDLKEQMEQLQREMLELRNTVKSCIDMQLHFQKSVTQDLSRSGQFYHHHHIKHILDLFVTKKSN